MKRLINTDSIKKPAIYTTCCFPEQTIYNHNDTNYYTPVTLDLPKTSTTQQNRSANWYGRIIVLKDFKDVTEF